MKKIPKLNEEEKKDFRLAMVIVVASLLLIGAFTVVIKFPEVFPGGGVFVILIGFAVVFGVITWATLKGASDSKVDNHD